MAALGQSAMISRPGAADGALDLAPLIEVFETDQAALIDFVLDALRELETSFSRFADAVPARDVSAVLSVAHALKGAGANIGAESFAAAMSQAESATGNQDWPAVQSALTRGSTALQAAVLWASARKAAL